MRCGYMLVSVAQIQGKAQTDNTDLSSFNPEPTATARAGAGAVALGSGLNMAHFLSAPLHHADVAQAHRTRQAAVVVFMMLRAILRVGVPLTLGISWWTGTFAASIAALAWAVAAWPLAGAAILAGIAATRQDEFRADHFGGWLTHPEWLAEYLRIPGPPRPAGIAGWWRALISEHPSDAARIRRLERHAR